MGNALVALVIGGVLYLAIKPIIKFKKQKGDGFTCYGCACSKDGNCTNKSH